MSPAYQESEDHVPNPLYQTGVVDTTGVTGDLGGRIENISPVFAQAKADAFASAVEAVEDPAVDESEQVVFHAEDGPETREEEVDDLKAAAEDAADNPQLEDPALTPAAQAAAEEGEAGEAEGDAARSSDGSAVTGTGGQPGDEDSKAKWAEYAHANDLKVDQGLNKAEYVAAVKKAKAGQ